MPNLDITPEFRPLFDKAHPEYYKRYKTWYGGRGGMKSWKIADALLMQGSEQSLNILCVREYMNSISDSVIAVLSTRAKTIGCAHEYEFQEKAIKSVKNNTVFNFAGIKQNINSLKSYEGADRVWNEEAQNTSAKSIQTLYPTIRKPGSQIWTSFNPGMVTDPIYVRHVTRFNPKSDYLCLVNYTDNPWISDDFIEEAEQMRLTDYDSYAHIYLGQCWTRSDAQVFNGKWEVRGFEPADDWDGPYHGLDFGFAMDPTFGVKVWITPANQLMIEFEMSRLHLELDDTLPALENVFPNIKEYVVRADSARPETISHLKSKGLSKIEGVEKWAGSVEDGVTIIRSFKRIVIHPRCTNMINEARLYSYKVDKKTEDILPDIVDKHNHGWDAVRYALAPFIKRKARGFFDV